jgi:hypothetical protein
MHLLNEKKAIELLSEKNITEPYLLSQSYNHTCFLIVKELKGVINKKYNHDISLILNAFKKSQSFLLINHPRIKQLCELLNTFNLKNYINSLQKICKSSHELYFEVFEHGDFAPWNIVESAKEYVPFDFEYFEENGLEHLDEIKYHYQIQHLLNRKTGKELINSVSTKVVLKEFEIVFKVFLIKEIINKKRTKQSFELEESLFKLLNNG